MLPQRTDFGFVRGAHFHPDLTGTERGQNAVFSFCENTLTGIAGLNTITSDWNGEYWEIEALGFNLAPATTLDAGCPDPEGTALDLR